MGRRPSTLAIYSLIFSSAYPEKPIYLDRWLDDNTHHFIMEGGWTSHPDLGRDRYEEQLGSLAYRTVRLTEQQLIEYFEDLPCYLQTLVDKHIKSHTAVQN